MTACTPPRPSEGSSPAASTMDPIAEHERIVRPLEKELALAWWAANTTGKQEDFARKETAQNQLDAALADRGRFARLKEARAARPAAPQVRRSLEVLYLQYLEKQVDPELLQRIAARSNKIEMDFNNFRARVAGKELTDSQVRKILKESRDAAERQAVWEAAKVVGAVVEKDLKDLVKLRNEAARKLGFRSYHAMQLELNEQKQEDVLRLFDEIHALTREPFARAKAEIDARLAKDHGVAVEALRPWHYHDPFFQEPPAIHDVDLDAPYKQADILALCRDFYAGLGLPIDDVLSRSDLHERAGKSPHAFCTDIDREGDVRVLANIIPNEYWMSTMLHELGHAVYSSKNIPRAVPYVLRGEAHILTTEGIAMLFEKFSKSAAWLTQMGVQVDAPAAFDQVGARMSRHRLLIFAAWCQVMLRFEKAMYDDPDQDLNKLWWDLAETYQGLRRPAGRDAPDYGSKIHIVSAPAYYHNYLMGQLFASQLHHTIARDVLKQPPHQALYNKRRDVGDFLRAKVFVPGKTLPWNELTRFATGETLQAKAFAADFGE